MATCQQCGMQLDQGDRFCMGCGTPQPALSSPGEQISDPRAAGGGAKFRPATTPTWLPADPPPASAQPQPPVPGALPAAAPGAAGAQPTPGNGVACPRCSAQLPAGARFCGDCGKQLDGTSGAAAAQAAVPPVMAPPNPFSAPLATPIPPFTPPPTPLPAAPAQSVLPAFRPGGWADASIPPPEGGPADQSWLAAPTFGNTALPRAIGQAAIGQAASGHLPVSAVPWPADPASAGPTNTAPTPIGGLVLPLAPPPFQPQWLAAGPGGPGFPPGQPNPGGRAQPGKRKHPRSQVITMLVAGIISLVFGIAGVVAQVLLNK